MAGWLISSQVIPARNISPKIQKVLNALVDRRFFDGMTPVNIKEKVCFHHVGGEGPQTLFLGDSNMQQYAPRIARLMMEKKKDERGCIFLTGGGVPPIPNVTKGEMMYVFQKIILEDKRIDRVVIASWWHGYFIKETLYKLNGTSFADTTLKTKAVDEIAREIRRLVNMGKRVTLVLSVPTGWGFEPKNMFSRGFLGFQLKDSEKVTKWNFLNEYGEMPIKLAKVARENGAEVIDPMDYLCTNGVCISENEDGPIRYDSCHLRPGYVRDHVKYLDQTVAP
jgi:hypothetical protein